MKAQYTPGPWILDDRGCKFIVHKPGDGYITRDVCRMDSSTMAAFAQEANARLIAAAPDLLEALQSFPGFTDDAAIGDPWMEQMRTAIAKATGETK